MEVLSRRTSDNAVYRPERRRNPSRAPYISALGFCMLNLMEKHLEKHLRTLIELSAATRSCAAILLLLACCAVGQEATGRPAFEAASIKPSDRNSGFPPQMIAIMRAEGVGASKTVPMKDPVTVSLRNTPWKP